MEPRRTGPAWTYVASILGACAPGFAPPGPTSDTLVDASLPTGDAATPSSGPSNDAGPPDAGVQSRTRLRVLTPSDIVTTHEGQRAKPGDFRLENDDVAFVIAGPTEHDTFAHLGGFVVDAELLSPSGPPYDGIDEVFPQVNGCLLAPRAFEVVADGADGRAVRLRFAADEAPIAALNLVGTVPDPRGFQAVVEYALAPTGRALEITTHVTNATAVAAPATVGDFALFDSDESAEFSLPHGFWLESTDTRVPAVGIGHETLPWVALLHAGTEPLVLGGGATVRDMAEPDQGIWQAAQPSVTLEPGESRTFTRYLVLGPDVSSAARHQLEITAHPRGIAVGRVQAGPDPVAGARVSFFSADDSARFLGQTITDADGRFQAVVPAGPVRAVASAVMNGEHVETPGRPRLLAEGMRAGPGQDAVLSADGQVTFALTLAAPARVPLRVRDERARPMTAKVTFIAEDERPAPLAAAGESEAYPSERIAFVFWTVDGELDAALPPGSYTVVASHGPGYTIDTQQVELRAGEGPPLTFTLAPWIFAPGWVSIDSHLHARDSQHGNATRAERTITAVAEGLDVLINTDHDFISAYEPVVSALGLQDRVLSVPGVELSRPGNHHHNLWPLTPQTAPRGGGFRWWLDHTLDEALDHYTALGATVIQINHGKLAFADAGFDPATGSIREDADFSWRANAMELQNGKLSSSRAALVPIWYALLAQGRRLSPLGASDSHGRTPEAGSARTYVRLGDASPSAEAIAEAVVAGRTVASTGPLVLLSTSDGAQVGDTLHLSEGSVTTLHVEVQAAEWLGLTRVRLIQAGNVAATWDATTTPSVAAPSTDAGVWFAHDVQVTLASDTWFAVEVSGDAPLAPVYPGATAWAHSAPLWVEVTPQDAP